MKSAEEILNELMKKKFVQVNCLSGKTCDDGKCKASLSFNDGKYTLVTGIIPNADYLGSCSFSKSAIESDDGKNVVWANAVFSDRVDEIQISHYVSPA